PNAKRLAEARGQQRYYVRGTFTAYNADFSKDVLALAQAGFEQISIEPVVAEPGCEWALTQEHMPEVLAEYERLAQAYLKERKEGKGFNFFHFMVDLPGGPCLRKRLTGCGAGNEYVAVTPEGDIYPCHQFVGREGFRMGSVLDDTFDRTIQARFAASHVLSKPACRACWARFFCSGGCAANAHQMNGSIDQPYDLACQMQKKRLECALAIYAIERGDD
ncbi:MAG TPA: SPASM domain-containing protein, partial [Clostridia bacterium]|nr:SPASM domain-containing protein [Clostridia bacterium]